MSIWTGKRVLITGHSGFKGGWLSLMLHKEGARLTGLSLRPETDPNLYTVAKVGDCVETWFADIRSTDKVQEIFRTVKPEVVFHLAAQALVRRSYADPVGTIETNVIGTVNILEAARNCPSVQVLINVTSDKCYENRNVVWPYREYDPMGGSDPYSGSKGCAELVANAYRRSFFSGGDKKLVSVRAGNVVGGGDWSQDRLVPDCVRAFSRKEKVLVRNPKSLRPWQHVLEPLSGYVMVAEKLLSNVPVEPAYNFGPSVDDAHSVAELVDTMAQCWGGDASWSLDSRPSPPESKLLLLDSTLARTDLSWQPRLDVKRCIEWTVDWYQRQLHGEDMQAFTTRQIEEYGVLRY